MKKLLLFLLPLLLVISCKPRLEEVVEERHANGNPRMVAYYQDIDGIREKVKVVAWYESGQIRYEGEYAHGKRNGFWVYWYENGNKWSEGYFKDDLRDGFGTTWYKNGRKHYEGSYKDGIRVGVWKFWMPEGEMVKEIDYDD